MNSKKNTIQLDEIKKKIQESENLLKQLNLKLEKTKKERNLSEDTLHSLQNNHQQKTYKLERLEITQQEKKESLISLNKQLKLKESELPNPLPEVPLLNKIELENTDLTPHIEQIKKEIWNNKKRLEGMEPVNMLALEEYEKTQIRLTELTDKLSTIEGERDRIIIENRKFYHFKISFLSRNF